MKQRTDKSDINEEYNISIFRNGGLPRLPELVKHDDSERKTTLLRDNFNKT